MNNHQIDTLISCVSEFSNKNGSIIIQTVEDCSSLVLLWLDYLNSYKRTGIADEILDAYSSSIRETSACLVLGMLRPAIFSMRIQIDLILAWIYFKDHPKEWHRINATGDGFKLKKELFDYLTNHYTGFHTRYGILNQTIKRKELDMYRLLSAHIHGQSSPVLPSTKDLSDIVQGKINCIEVAQATGDLAEYISDILYAVYADQLHSIPKQIVDSVDSRLATLNLKKGFYATV